MKKLFIVIVIVLIVLTSWYFWNGREGVRNYYEGYMQIEPVSVSAIIGLLEKAGCTENGSSCHYVTDNNKNNLYINLFAKGVVPFGPGDRLDIVGSKVYSSADLKGRRSPKIFENYIKDEILRSGGVVKPIDGTLIITKTYDSTGRIY